MGFLNPLKTEDQREKPFGNCSTVRGFTCVARRAKSCLRDLSSDEAASFQTGFWLRDQITRAATSTMSNIAEGFERGTRKDFVRFLNMAKGSNGEVRSQLYIAFDQEYIEQKTFGELRESTLALSRRLAKFITYLESYPKDSRIRNPGITKK
jgi:four helix bundle protein